MEMWFTRAMELNTNNYDACAGKLYYLYPQWYGSAQEMIEFGRQCVRSDVWGGSVPLVLADAHEQIARYLRDESARLAYWKQPDVWPDIQAAFDRFFELNPDEVGYRHNYAWYAYNCGQWNEFLRQSTLFSAGTNYDYFGGKDTFDQMMAMARENAGK